MNEIKDSFREQIGRLQQRQFELVQETVSLLSEEVERSTAPLHQEIAELRQALYKAETEKNLLANRMESLQLSSREQMRGFYRQIQALSHERLLELEEVLTEIEAPLSNTAAIVLPPSENSPAALPATIPLASKALAPKTSHFSLPRHLPAPIKAEVATPVATPIPLAKPVKADKPPKPKRAKPAKSPRSSGRVFKPVFSLGVIALLSYVGASKLPMLHPSVSSESGQVEGVSTDKSVQAEAQEPEYAESKATVPFVKTTWKQYTNSDFNLSVQYPDNATNLVAIPGGSNIWFLRKDGYLMKMSKFSLAFNQTLDQWWETAQSDYSSDYHLSKTTFKGQPAWYAESITTSATSGSSYFIDYNSSIIQVWIKDEDPTSDDGQRIAKMLESLQIGSY